jgi:hypothetical protein
MPYVYQDEPAVPKIFVMICHEGSCAICFKATSGVDIYENNPDLKAGVVFYKAKSLPFFPLNTAIQPDNPHPIAHVDIRRCMTNGSFEHLGEMPDNFGDLLVAAIKSSITMKPSRKANWLKRI